MENYAVSFCIPTYNRSELIWKVVTEILASTESGFQVVVSDNGSTDNTWERLSTISDTRLKLCRNPYAAEPPQLNWLNALNEGDGKWLYLVMGRDLILADHIPELISRLKIAEKKKVAYVYENYENSQGVTLQCRYYTKKADALQRFMCYAHPTGHIFRKDAFDRISDKEKACMCIDVYFDHYIKSKIIENWNCLELPPIVNKEVGWAWGGM